MRRVCRAALLGAGLVLVSACATRPPGPGQAPPLTDPAAIEAAREAQAQRALWLLQQPGWTFEGRLAVSSGGQGGSGRIDWQQQGDAYVVSLSAPVTRQSWRLSGDLQSQAGLLEGLEGGPRQAEDAEALLREATGWDIPVNALARWVVGLPAEALPVEVEAYAAKGQLLQLGQAGWRIDYPLWFDADPKQPALPRRIDARRDGASVRLIIDRWGFPSP